MKILQKAYKILKIFLIISTLLVILGIIVIALINVGINAFSAKKIYQLKNAPKATVAIVLGARVLPDKSLSDILKDRALTAVELWENEKVQKILVSGDNGSQYYNEVVPDSYSTDPYFRDAESFYIEQYENKEKVKNQGLIDRKHMGSILIS